MDNGDCEDGEDDDDGDDCEDGEDGNMVPSLTLPADHLWRRRLLFFR